MYNYCAVIPLPLGGGGEWLFFPPRSGDDVPSDESSTESEDTVIDESYSTSFENSDSVYIRSFVLSSSDFKLKKKICWIFIELFEEIALLLQNNHPSCIIIIFFFSAFYRTVFWADIRALPCHQIYWACMFFSWSSFFSDSDLTLARQAYIRICKNIKTQKFIIVVLFVILCRSFLIWLVAIFIVSYIVCLFFEIIFL